MDLLSVFSRSMRNERRASMSDYEEVKSMVNAAALLANAAKAEMLRVEAEEEEMGCSKPQQQQQQQQHKKNDRNKSNKRVPKGATLDIAPVDVPQIEVIDVDGMHHPFASSQSNSSFFHAPFLTCI